MKTLEELNRMEEHQVTQAFTTCCGSSRWAALMNEARPFTSTESVREHADNLWAEMKRADILEAFSHHPKIGTKENLREKFASTAAWASNEQSGIAQADDATLDALARGNEDYEKRFGYLFIVCASGKSASEMLRLLEVRLENDPETEFHIATQEQAKITQLRLDKLLERTS